MNDNLKKALSYAVNFAVTSVVASVQKERNEAYCERYGYKKGGLMNLIMNDRDRINRMNNGMLF